MSGVSGRLTGRAAASGWGSGRLTGRVAVSWGVWASHRVGGVWAPHREGGCERGSGQYLAVHTHPATVQGVLTQA